MVIRSRFKHITSMNVNMKPATYSTACVIDGGGRRKGFGRKEGVEYGRKFTQCDLINTHVPCEHHSSHIT